MQDGKAKRETITFDQVLTKDQQQEKLKQPKISTNLGIRAILNGEQLAKLASLRADKRNRPGSDSTAVEPGL